MQWGGKILGHYSTKFEFPLPFSASRTNHWRYSRKYCAWHSKPALESVLVSPLLLHHKWYLGRIKEREATCSGLPLSATNWCAASTANPLGEASIPPSSVKYEYPDEFIFSQDWMRRDLKSRTLFESYGRRKTHCMHPLIRSYGKFGLPDC